MATMAVGAADEKFEQHLIAGGELLRRDRVQEARREFEAALALRPSDRKALGLVGLACFRQSAYDDALVVYDRLVAAEPNDASYRMNLGLVHLKLGHPDEAIAELSRARELDPSMTKAVGYLGLAHARNGNYLEAYEAFKRVGQEDLAAEMEQHLSVAQIAGVKKKLAGGAAADDPIATPAPAPTHTPPPPPPPKARTRARLARESEPPPRAVSSEPVAEAQIQEEVAERPETSDPEVEFDEEPKRYEGAAVAERRAEAAAATPGVVVAEQQGAITEAVAAAVPSREAVAAAAPASLGHEPPQPLSKFATQRMIRPEDSDHPFEISAGGVLIVRVRGRIMSRTEGVIVSGGELAYEPATRKVRGNLIDEPFGGERPLFIVTGDGHLVASPLGTHFAAVSLDDDVLYVREDLVFAFEERLRWENGYVPGSDTRIAVVQFRGTGCVAIRTGQPTLAVKLGPERVLYVDADALAGWVGRVVPRVVAPAAGGEASALFVECSGEGVVLLEDELSRQAEQP
jgi:tetratricopeptide (TPR) repeat protein/uncharacterized protein (AIM24 family)